MVGGKWNSTTVDYDCCVPRTRSFDNIARARCLRPRANFGVRVTLSRQRNHRARSNKDSRDGPGRMCEGDEGWRQSIATADEVEHLAYCQHNKLSRVGRAPISDRIHHPADTAATNDTRVSRRSTGGKGGGSNRML